jgi:hypothetical protein
VAAKKKSTVVKKKAIKKKSVTPVRKPAARTIKTIKKKTPKKPVVIPEKEIEEANQPPVKETSLEINNDITPPAQDIVTPVPDAITPEQDIVVIKETQKAAARHYDNHHIRLSSRKGGFKASGKKPLW